MRKRFLLAVFLCSIYAWGQSPPPDCSSGFCAGVGAPAFSCKAGNKYSQLDSPGTGYSCTGIPPHWVQDAGGGGASVTLENVYAAPGSFTFAHNLNSLFYQVTCFIRSNGAYAPATVSAAPVDVNDASITVPAAGDYICSFTAASSTPDFLLVASTPTLLYEPTMTGTQQPTFTDIQTALGGYSNTVTYSISGLASGMTGAFSPTTITGTGNNTLTLSFPATQTPATTSFTIQGTDGTKTHSTAPSITVGTINQGLVECWAGNDGSGTSFADSCGTSNTATLQTGTLTWGTNTGFPGSSALFSATAYLTGANQTATNFNGSTAFSGSVWFIPNGATNSSRTFMGDLQTSANNYTGWEISLAGGKPNFYLINNFTGNNYINVSSNVIFTAATIHNLTFTYDGSRTAAGVKLYLDGTSLIPTINKDTLTASTVSTQNVSIGGRTDGSIPVNSVLGEMRLWSRVLSAIDVTNYVAAGAR